MACIFTNRSLLDKEYKRLFLEKLSTITKAKVCLSARYDKKEITDAELKVLLSNNHKKIYEFIGRSNENRIRYFFGHSTQSDLRDSQIRLIDRLILDSIHFEVINMLMLQFADEYSNNQSEIDKEWNHELQNHTEYGSLPNMLIIQNAIKSIKNSVFKDLVFPEKKTVALFHLKGQSIIPNEHIFINWLSQPNTKSHIKLDHIIYVGVASALIVLFSLVYFIASWSLNGSTAAGIGATFAASLNPVGFATGLAIALILSGMMSYALSNPMKGSFDSINPSLSNIEQCPNQHSTELMITKLLKNEPIVELNMRPPADGIDAIFANTSLILEDAIQYEEQHNNLNLNL